MNLGVYCECGKCLPVNESDAGSAVDCTCGRRVIVPLLEEFQWRPVLLSAASIERRVQRLIAAGELPSREAGCARCGDVTRAEVVKLDLECERAQMRGGSGGLRMLILPGFRVWWTEEAWVEVKGRDTNVVVALCLCPVCRQMLRAPREGKYLLTAILMIAGSVLLGFVHVLLGIGTALLTMTILYGLKRRALNRHQHALKSRLRKVPVYGQLLARYPRAFVVLPDPGSSRDQAPI